MWPKKACGNFWGSKFLQGFLLILPFYSSRGRIPGGIKSRKHAMRDNSEEFFTIQKMGGLTKFSGGGVQNPSNDPICGRSEITKLFFWTNLHGNLQQFPKISSAKKKTSKFPQLHSKTEKRPVGASKRLPVFSHQISTWGWIRCASPQTKGFMAGKWLNPNRNKVSKVGLQLQ